MNQYPIEIKTKRHQRIFDYFTDRYRKEVAEPNDLNLDAIASYTILFCEIEDMKRFLKKNGYTYASVSHVGNSKQQARPASKARPEVSMLEKMETRIYQMKKSLGFYVNENAKGVGQQDELEAFLRG